MLPFKIATTERPDGIAVLEIEGPCDGTNASKVHAAAQELLKRKVGRIIVHMKKVDFVSSAGVGSFIGLIDGATRLQSRVVFAAIHPEVKNLFDMLGLSSLATISESLDAGVKLLGPPAA